MVPVLRSSDIARVEARNNDKAETRVVLDLKKSDEEGILKEWLQQERCWMQERQ